MTKNETIDTTTPTETPALPPIRRTAEWIWRERSCWLPILLDQLLNGIGL